MCLVRGLGWLALGLIVLVCVGASMTFAFEFGWTRGATDVHRWTFALAAAGLDGFKTALPILAARARINEEAAKAWFAWAAFCFLTVMSLWCAYGTSAMQLAERMAEQAAAKATQANKQATLDRLVRQRKVMEFVETSEEVVETAKTNLAKASEQVIAERARGGCKELCREREAEEREAGKVLQKAQINRAATDKAADLDAKIEVAERAISPADLRTGSKEVDPQSASMAKAIGGDQNVIAVISQAILAIAIEIGSGFGFWFLFHNATLRKEVAARVAAKSIEPIIAVLEPWPVLDSPRDIVERFFAEVVRHALNSRVQSVRMYFAFEQWCADRGIDPFSHAMFGRLARWPKAKIGGVVWYCDCELAEGYAILTRPRETKALPRSITEGSRTTH